MTNRFQNLFSKWQETGVEKLLEQNVESSNYDKRVKKMIKLQKKKNLTNGISEGTSFWNLKM